MIKIIYTGTLLKWRKYPFELGILNYNEVHFVNRVTREESRRIQEEADILLDIAPIGADTAVSMKFIEYIKTGKPILHFSYDGNSYGTSLINRWGLGKAFTSKSSRESVQEWIKNPVCNRTYNNELHIDNQYSILQNIINKYVPENKLKFKTKIKTTDL